MYEIIAKGLDLQKLFENFSWMKLLVGVIFLLLLIDNILMSLKDREMQKQLLNMTHETQLQKEEINKVLAKEKALHTDFIIYKYKKELAEEYLNIISDYNYQIIDDREKYLEHVALSPEEKVAKKDSFEKDWENRRKSRELLRRNYYNKVALLKADFGEEANKKLKVFTKLEKSYRDLKSGTFPEDDVWIKAYRDAMLVIANKVSEHSQKINKDRGLLHTSD